MKLRPPGCDRKRMSAFMPDPRFWFKLKSKFMFAGLPSDNSFPNHSRVSKIIVFKQTIICYHIFKSAKCQVSGVKCQEKF